MQHSPTVADADLGHRALNLDGSSRLIHLSIDEDVQLTYGRGGQGVVDSQRWIDRSEPGNDEDAIPLIAVRDAMCSSAITAFKRTSLHLR